MKFNKQYYTINEVCRMFGIETPKHITSNKELTRLNKGQFDIIRESSHDGTLIFTKELLGDAIENLINKKSYFIKDDMSGVKDISYEVGLISLATVYGSVDLPIGRYHGEKQRVRIPVRCILKR